MKKFLFFYAVIFAFMSRQNEVQAKAVKLGRGNAYSVAADTKLNNGAGSAKVDTEKNATVPVRPAIRQQENASAVRREKGLTARDASITVIT